MTTKPISEQEFIEMAKRCSDEIKELRATIDRLRPKADAYDSVCIILGLLPRRSESFGEDLAWKLDRRIDELKKAKAPVPTDAELATE
ncbi:hypothetical protein ACIQUB_07180 [Rhizobium sp. NPDC090275]|uniref:hypothetical protein n=1 Tax=Rhizobium sp. NPDC090275 TaxID=3364498 RepID=UPI00383AB3F9